MKYDEAGIYELTYRAVDDCGNEAIATREITVEEEPPSEWIVSFDVSDYTVPNSNPSPLLADWNPQGIEDFEAEVVNPMCTMRNGDVVPYTDLAEYDLVIPRTDIDYIDAYDEYAVIYLWDYVAGESAGISLGKNGDSFTTDLDNTISYGLRDVVSIHFDKLAYKYKLY